jgi:hypothetical protein
MILTGKEIHGLFSYPDSPKAGPAYLNPGPTCPAHKAWHLSDKGDWLNEMTSRAKIQSRLAGITATGHIVGAAHLRALFGRYTCCPTPSASTPIGTRLRSLSMFLGRTHDPLPHYPRESTTS